MTSGTPLDNIELRNKELYDIFGILPANEFLTHKEYARARTWLTAYLENRQDLLSHEESKALSLYASIPQPEAFSRLLTHVAKQLTNPGKPSLNNIVQGLKHARPGGVQPSAVVTAEQDEQQTKIVEILVFRAMGWLTMLYEPLDRSNNKYQQQPGTVDGNSPEDLLVAMPMTMHGHIINTNVFDVDDNRHLGGYQKIDYIWQAFREMGEELIPHPLTWSRPESLRSGTTRPDFFSEQLVLSYLNYYTLKKVAKIEMEFVPLLSMHLDFDEESQTLKIFAFPSWCILMTKGGRRSKNGQLPSDQRPYLDQLVKNYLKGQMEESNQQKVDYPALCREILLSYSLIFGQNEYASELFKKEFLKQRRQNRQPRFPWDDLMLDLCGTYSKKNLVFRRIGLPHTKEQYSVQKDFRFLGARLVKLQRFVVEQDPTDWQSLLHDKRDILRYWTFWAVIWVGGLSILLSTMQVGLGIAQVVYAIKQNGRV